MQNKKKRWRVRVLKKVEDWIEVITETKDEAEKEAAFRPGVISIFKGSTISGEKPVGTVVPIGVEEDAD